MEITIRRLKPGDVERLSVIEEESFSMPWSAKAFADLLDRPYCLYLVAEAEGNVIGCCGLTNICNEGNIDNVVVDNAFRGKGVAQKMLRELIRQGRQEGIADFTLEVRVSNEPAIHVYEKLGFVSEGIRPHFYEKPEEDALIMWRRR